MRRRHKRLGMMLLTEESSSLIIRTAAAIVWLLNSLSVTQSAIFEKMPPFPGSDSAFSFHFACYLSPHTLRPLITAIFHLSKAVTLLFCQLLDQYQSDTPKKGSSLLFAGRKRRFQLYFIERQEDIINQIRKSTERPKEDRAMFTF